MGPRRYRFDLAALIAVLALLLVAAARPAAAQEEIAWMVQDLPPVFVRSGPDKDRGIGDRQMAILLQRLPEFRHHVVDTSFARAWHDIAERDGICISGVFKTAERLSRAAFSAPIAFADSIRMVVRADGAGRFASLLDADGRIDIDALARRGDLVGAYAPKRSLGNRLDAYVHAEASAQRMEALPNEFQLFNLLQSGRIDFMFATPREVSHNAGHASLATYPIAGEPDRVDIFVACSNQAVGLQVIRRVDWLLQHTDLGAVLRAERDK
jgi:uncharacterized protein (TIGR02285 family)